MQPIEFSQAYKAAVNARDAYYASLKAKQQTWEKNWFERRMKEVNAIDDRLFNIPDRIDPYEGDLTGTLHSTIESWNDSRKLKSNCNEVNRFFQTYFNGIKSCFDLKIALGRFVYDQGQGLDSNQEILKLKEQAKAHAVALNALGFGYLGAFMSQVEVDAAALAGLKLVEPVEPSHHAPLAPPKLNAKDEDLVVTPSGKAEIQGGLATLLGDHLNGVLVRLEDLLAMDDESFSEDQQAPQ